VARALDAIGDRWVILILRDLFRTESVRFQGLLASLPGIGPNTLAGRLKKLEEKGFIERRFYSDHPPRAEYVLTDKGRSLGPILLALKRWGEQHPS